MKQLVSHFFATAAACLSLLVVQIANGQTTAFTYQGRLTSGTNVANGSYDMKFVLYNTNGFAFGGASNYLAAVPVNNGLFTVALDFGNGFFTGQDRQLEISVRTNGAGGFTTLNPRQPLNPSPYSIYAYGAGTANSASSANSATTASGVVAGSVTAAGIASGEVVKSLNGLKDAVALAQGTNVTITTSNQTLIISSSGGGAAGSSPWLTNGTSLYYNSGKVGIGTTSPGGKLNVVTSDDVTPSVIFNFDDRHLLIGTASQGIGLSFSPTTGAGYISALSPGAAWRDLYLQANTLSFSPAGGTTTFSLNSFGVSLTSAQGISLNAYDGPMITRGHDPFNLFLADKGGLGRWGLFMEPSTLVIGIPQTDVGPRQFEVASYNKNGARTALFTVGNTGSASFSGTNVSVCSLTIRGGCDLAEPFQMSSKEIPSGAVVVIDEEHPGQLKMSDHAYDTRVAGIVSGANGINPGIAMKQEGVLDIGNNVSLSGRVYVAADASYGSIKPGDLLTTSNTPGHAMKVTDPAKAQSAILGKAMSNLAEGKGMVLVLVTLQ